MNSYQNFLNRKEVKMRNYYAIEATYGLNVFFETEGITRGIVGTVNVFSSKKERDIWVSNGNPSYTNAGAREILTYRSAKKYDARDYIMHREKFEAEIKVGTKVYLGDHQGWCICSSIHPTRNWIQVEGWVGSFPRAHVKRYTNK